MPIKTIRSLYQAKSCFDGSGAVGPDITTGLISYWLMNDGSGTTAVDSISGHNMTMGSSAWTSDWFNFGGSSTGTVANHADFTVTTGMTLFFWIKGTSQALAWLNERFLNLANNSVWGILNNGSTIIWTVCDDGQAAAGHQKEEDGSQTIFDNTWHSVAVRFGSNDIDIFTDGVKDVSPTRPDNDSFTTLFNGTGPITFGSGGANVSQKKIRFYNIAKSDADIAAMHAVGA